MDEPRPVEPVSASEGALLGRYRVLQVLSVAMILAGILLGAIAVVGNPGLLSEAQTPESARRLLGALLLLGLGALLLVSGLVMNATRAVIVRAALPPERYRGPAIFVLLLLALILGNLVGLGAAADAIKLVAGGQMTVAGTLVLVTAIQTGMLIVVGGLVVLPRALAGLRLASPRSLWRDLLIGLGVAIPAWIAATLISALIALVLKAMGLAPGPGAPRRLVERHMRTRARYSGGGLRVGRPVRRDSRSCPVRARPLPRRHPRPPLPGDAQPARHHGGACQLQRDLAHPGAACPAEDPGSPDLTDKALVIGR